MYHISFNVWSNTKKIKYHPSKTIFTFTVEAKKNIVQNHKKIFRDSLKTVAASRTGQRRTAVISLLIAFFFFQVQQEQQIARTKMRQNTQIRAKILFSLDRKQWRTGRPLSFSERHLGLPNCWQPLQNLLWVQVWEIYEWHQYDCLNTSPSPGTVCQLRPSLPYCLSSSMQ